ncbi:MAG: hypothetical protein FWD95_04515 [Nocardioidaceae bacterium]|nr:hypothetical protein [Nocardioidaceae bacterium]
MILEITGWGMLLAGIAALILPGPGLLLVLAGLVALSRRHAWAARWVEPVRVRAVRGAAHGVRSRPRILGSCLGALCLAALGVLWLVHPREPSWWPLRRTWWLFGGWWTGATLLVSSLAAFALIGYSYRRFHADPDALAALIAPETDR